MCQREALGSNWKQRPVIRGTAHNPQLPKLLLLVHSQTFSRNEILKPEFHSFCWGCHLYSLSTTCHQYTVVGTVLCVFRFPDCRMVPIGMMHHGNQLCLLRALEVGSPSRLLLPTLQWPNYFQTRLIPFQNNKSYFSHVLNNAQIRLSKTLI